MPSLLLIDNYFVDVHKSQGQKTHSFYRYKQTQKNSLRKREKMKSIENVCVKWLKEQGLSDSMGKVRPGHTILLYLKFS